MNIKIGEIILSIRWEHKRFTKDKHGRPNHAKEATKRWTRCYIYLGSGKDSDLIATGIAVCHKDDTFCKCKGRKLSLSDALLLLNETHNQLPPISLTKDDRLSIWLKLAMETSCDFQISTKATKKKRPTVVNDISAEFCERLDE